MVEVRTVPCCKCPPGRGPKAKICECRCHDSWRFMYRHGNFSEEPLEMLW